MDAPTKKIVLLGAGGHARTLLAVLRRMPGVVVIGMTTADPREAGQTRNGIKILGSDETITKWRSNEIQLVNGIGTDSTTNLRRQIYEKFKKIGYEFFSTVDPSAMIDSGVGLAEGCQVQMGALVQAGASLGRNVLVNTGVLIEHDCTISDHVHIAPGSVLCGGVQVGMGCFIGAGTVVRQGVKIGDGANVGAGSLVLKDIPPMTLSYGHPARVVRSL